MINNDQQTHKVKQSLTHKVLLADLGHTEVHAVNTQSETEFYTQSLAS